MALALYRRYRPDTFDGIIGQDQVTVPLSRALDEGKLTHAYLFSGPRGCGKTSSARILARCINCAKGPTSHPCGECESCKDLATGGPGSIDVVEIDAASHNGVEDARELRERAAFAPARDRYKIFILDEAHMVTQQGFNALLKIVEEPPEHVMFIFATTEPDKVISTIRSRTHHYPFRLVPPEVMGPYLEEVCDKEKIDLEPGVLKLTMRAGGGSVRDTLSVLDQLMAGAVDNEVSYDSAVALLGFTPDELIGEAIDAVIDKDGERLYGVVEKVVVGGFEPRRFVEDLLSRVRDLLVLTLGGEKAENVLSDDSAVEDMSDLHRQSKALGLSTLTAMAETINDTLGNMTGAISPRMRLELLAAKLLAGRENGFAPSAVQAGTGAASTGSSRPAAANNESRQGNNAPQSRGGFIGSSRNAANQRQNNRQAGAGPAAASQAPEQHNASRTQQVGNNPDSPVAGTGTASVSASAGIGEPHGWQGNANGGMQPDRHSSDPNAATNAAGSNPERQQGDQKAATVQVNVDPNATVEQRWDIVLKSLPEDVRGYVAHDKVPTVSLARNDAGKSRLSMTFDCPLSQHAFALALASDAEHNGQKAANVVLAGVRSVFGPHTMIAPTGVAANGEKVVSTKRMKPEELAKVKRDIALAKVSATGGLGMAAGQSGHSASAPKEQKKAQADAAGESDDSSHRAAYPVGGNGRDGETVSRADSTDTKPGNGSSQGDAAGAGVPATNREHDAQNLANPMAMSPGSQNPMDDDYDPWMNPLPAPGSGNGTATNSTGGRQAAATSGGNASQQFDGNATGRPAPVEGSANQAVEHHKKHVAVPDLSDGIDPWATPSSDQAAAGSSSGAAGTDGDSAGRQSGDTGAARNATSASGPDNWQTRPPDSSANGSYASPDGIDAGRKPIAAESNNSRSRSAAPNGSPAANPDDRGDVAARFQYADDSAEDADQRPRVAAEDDDYSMSDQSLGDVTAVGLDELSKLFDVKKVETFKADDPKNPKNIKPAEKHPEEER
ncbi:DNA polymerase III subunit gamma/tau [Bifidobacterium sp. ESL0800]|uniref:DNA polymerase III subunit gamma/tau n=1 Tax=Bifidobacterium sp. ESL0800 TaxID=2983236 RepID=UPI0023F87C6D|nr:DNA polymerase III subunit gamma/tau [Bifidobacterium sp. ESL0800]WEV75094.1 DNA polymerase III subunit gamma/tau [Bifidobacterium sp. ESL0800]